MRPAEIAAAALMAAAAVQVAPAGSWLLPLRSRRLRGSGPPGSLALTFDDGPDRYGTPAVLDALDRLGWPATFFVLGEQVRRDPALLREIVDRGHEVACHGDTHRYLIARPPWEAFEDLRRGSDTIAGVTGEAPVWWRPPYGVLSGPALLAARAVGLQPLIWTRWGRDWRADATPGSVVADVSRGGLGGATVLLHDSDLMSAPGSWRTTVAALPLLAEQVAAAGLTPHRLSNHLAAAPAGP